jgi:hypothetical protein
MLFSEQVLACDGLFDVFEDHEVARLALDPNLHVAGVGGDGRPGMLVWVWYKRRRE